MIHQSISTSLGAQRWCILRTSGSRTLALAKHLISEGLEVWTPTRTLKQPARGLRLTPGMKPPMVEVDAPILPTFVFAREQHLFDLSTRLQEPGSACPPFSVFRHAGRIPLIGDREIVGLQQEERDAAALLQALRDEEDREERRKIRAAAARTEQARRRALRAEHRPFDKGQRVNVAEMPAMVGVTGVVESSNGRSAWVAFGPTLRMKIEAWQLSPVDVGDAALAA